MVNPAAAASLVVAGYPSPTIATVAHAFTVTAKDAYGNTDVNYTGTVHFTSSEYSAALPPDYAFVAGDGGTQTFSATMNLPVIHTLTATDTASSITGSQTGIVVTLLDTDNDGCADVYELGANHAAGGQRDPLNPWDFFDVAVPYSAIQTTAGKNKAINGADVLAVRNGTGHVAGDGVYNVQYDRTPSTASGEPWRSGPPNGAISGVDVLVARDSTGDSCL